jgi:hypothetical protein
MDKEPSLPSGAERQIMPELSNNREAAVYAEELLDIAQTRINQAAEDARQRGLSDDDIAEYIKDGVLSGQLPQIAERPLAMRDGRRPIFFVDETLPTPLKESLRVSTYEGQTHVRVREIKSISNLLDEAGKLLVLSPKGSSVPTVMSDGWRQQVTKLHDIVFPQE